MKWRRKLSGVAVTHHTLFAELGARVMCGCPRRCKRFLTALAMIGCGHVSGLEAQLCHMPRASMEIRRPGADQNCER